MVNSRMNSVLTVLVNSVTQEEDDILLVSSLHHHLTLLQIQIPCLPASLLSPPSKPFIAFPVFRSFDDPPPITDEWGEKSDLEPVYAPTQFPDADLAIEKDEWGAEFDTGNGTPQPDISATGGGNPNLDLKRCLVDFAYDTELGFRASPEVRTEVSELVNPLEAANPYLSPTQEPALLDDNWVLL